VLALLTLLHYLPQWLKNLVWMKANKSRGKGFTHPTLGYIPEGWEVHSFSQLFEFLPTNSFSREDLILEPGKNGVYNIHYGDIHATFKRQILDFEKQASEVPIVLDENVKISDSSFLKDGDLIIADASEDYKGVGECIEVTGIKKRKVISGLHTLAARPRNGKTIAGFRAYLLKHPLVFNNLKKLATGSKVYGISKTNVAQLEVVVPSIDAQVRFEKIFQTWDRAIEKTEQLIEYKQNIKNGLLHRLLTGKVRFKEFIKSKKMKKTKLGLIPEDWGYFKLGELVTVKDGTHVTPKYIESGVPFLRVTDIVNNQKNHNKRYISREEHKILTKTNKPAKGDILYSKNGTIGVAKLIDWDWEFSIFVSLALLRIRNSTIVHDEFLEIWLNSDLAKHEIYRGVKQGTVTNLHLEEIEQFRVVLPAKREQMKIAKVVRKVNKEIEHLTEKSEKLKNQKGGLMQTLLMGQIRVKN
jgi:type I restriction enzyme S subunit